MWHRSKAQDSAFCPRRGRDCSREFLATLCVTSPYIRPFCSSQGWRKKRHFCYGVCEMGKRIGKCVESLFHRLTLRKSVTFANGKASGADKLEIEGRSTCGPRRTGYWFDEATLSDRELSRTSLPSPAPSPASKMSALHTCRNCHESGNQTHRVKDLANVECTIFSVFTLP